MTLFDWLNQILVHKKSWDTFSESEQKSFSVYMINRWLSMDDDFIEIINYVQKYTIETLKPKDVYKLYCNLLPKGKRYNKYIKSRKDENYDNLLVSTMTNYFECSKLQANEYIGMMSREELKQILEMYGIEKKQVRKCLNGV